MNKRDLLKIIVNFGATAATATLATMVIKSNTFPRKLSEKIAVGIGGFIVSGMIADKAGEYAEDQVDKALEIKDMIKAQISEAEMTKQPVLIKEG